MELRDNNQNRIMILCNTPYQLIAAIQLKLTIYRCLSADLIITNVMKDGEKISQNLNNIKIFDNVYYLNIDLKRYESEIYKIDSILLRRIESELYEITNISIANRYSEYLFANIGEIGVYIGKYLAKINSKLKISMYEDGLSSYSRIYEKVINTKINNDNLLKRVYYNFFPDLFAKVHKYYLFNPDLIVWDCPYELCAIPTLNENPNEITSIFECIFDFSEIANSYSQDVIFFEESYYSDGIAIKDIELVNVMSEACGKENIFIKKHPRVTENRFGKLGYCTNDDHNIPWEILALKLNLDNKTLVSISSTAGINSLLLLNCNAKIILLYKCINLENERFTMTKEVIDKMISEFPSSFYVPENIEKLSELLIRRNIL